MNIFTKQGPSRGWAAALSALATALLAALAACGPGVGGTGTGSTGMAAPGATPVALCTSALASALQCPPAGSVTTPAPSPGQGTALTWWADSSAAWRTSARLEGHQIDLNLACQGLVFTGSWGSLPGQGERFFGTVTHGAGGRVEPATLVATLAGGQVMLQLLGEQGQLLAAPLPLQALPALPLAAACGS